MDFKVSMTVGAPEWDMMSVAKLTYFPLEKADYKPFTQVRCAFEEGKGLWVRFTVFEAKKAPESKVAARFEGESGYITLAVGADGKAYAENERVKADIQTDFFEGEDLQGIYWGANVFIDIKDVAFAGELEKGVWGNYYKFSRGKKENFGSFFPCDFTGMAKNRGSVKLRDEVKLLPAEKSGRFVFRRY